VRHAALIAAAVATVGTASVLPAKAECWSSTLTARVLGASSEGVVVIERTERTNAADSDLIWFEVLGPDGDRRGVLSPRRTATERATWRQVGQVPAVVGDAPTAAVVARRLSRELGLTPARERVHVWVRARDQNEVRAADGGLLFAVSARVGWSGDLRVRARLLEHPSTPFRFLELTTRDRCWAGSALERILETALVLIPPGRAEARPLAKKGRAELASARFHDAAADLRRALDLDPADLSLWRDLAQALAGTRTDWETARRQLDVPWPPYFAACFGERAGVLAAAASEAWDPYEDWVEATLDSHGCESRLLNMGVVPERPGPED
jgi:hypothetical protein